MTTLVNINTKSQLAKLIATENLTIQHNKVKTASFDTLNRILTLPIFKVQSGDVYDMLIAHECSHALYTPVDGWKKIQDDDELRAYVNVLEDTRIDKLIQKKYPGVVRNYLNGFDIMEKQNFFGISGKNINTGLMLIDKINLRSKSMNRLPFKFSEIENDWIKKVDDIKTFNQVVKLAKEMLDWQKKQVEQMKKLPNFDNLELVENYNLDEDLDSENNVNTKNKEDSDNDTNDDQWSSSSKDTNDNDEESKDENDDKNKAANVVNPDGAGGEQGGVDPKKLIVITDNSYEKNKQSLFDETISYTYVNLPEPNLNKIMITSKDWIKRWKEISMKKGEYTNFNLSKRLDYINWLKNDFKKFKNDNKKTVMYLVKEFEMKKSASSYRRATQNKTGVIDTLKLKDYKFSEDIFKKLTVLPDAKNHGMIMLLDWSGSMSDIIKQTVDQLMNLVWFCQKINIPFEVYLFTSEAYETARSRYDENGERIITEESWNYKHGDGQFGEFNLINVASHKMKKIDLDESLMYLHHMGHYYNTRYTRSYWDADKGFEGDRFDIPKEYYLGTTPLNESLVVMNKLVPIFKKKYNIEKMTFITLTDGGSDNNWGLRTIKNTDNGLKLNLGKESSTPIITIGKKQYKNTSKSYWSGGTVTNLLLKVLQDQHNINTIGFYVIKRLNRFHTLDRYIGNYKDYSDKEVKIEKMKKQFSKDKVAIGYQEGYNKYFILNGKDMDVQNTDLSAVSEGMKTGKIKQLFSKSMRGRIVSRTLLNKFIEEVA